jgi:hypothetical protein
MRWNAWLAVLLHSLRPVLIVPTRAAASPRSQRSLAAETDLAL